MIGYHGTIEKHADAIVEEQSFFHSAKDIEWLGSGVYFFAHEYHAKKWAKQESRKRWNRDCSAIVLAADLKYDKAELLDLDDPQSLLDINMLLEELTARVPSCKANWEKCINAPKKAKERQWCFACNLYRDINSRIAVTSFTFDYWNKDLQNSVYDYRQKQICVSKDQNITNIRKEVVL